MLPFAISSGITWVKAVFYLFCLQFLRCFMDIGEGCRLLKFTKLAQSLIKLYCRILEGPKPA